MKVIIHNGTKQKDWTYSYVPNVGEEVVASVSSFKVIRKAFEPETNTIHLYLKTIEAKPRETEKSASHEKQCEVLINEIKPYLEEFGKEMCNDFYNYWTEEITKGRLKGQCRYVEQKTWSIYKRLSTWSSNNFDKK